jgi:hypothetical protein
VPNKRDAAARLDRIVREQQENVVFVAQPMDEEAQVANNSGSGNKQPTGGSRMKLIAVILAILAIIGAAVGAVLGLVVFKPDPTPQPVPTTATNPKPTPAPTGPTNPSPTSLPSQVALTDLLSEHASFDDGAALQTPYTPQNKALNWLRDTSNLDSFLDEKKIQRYILATLYYSTNGDGWTRNDGWLSDDDECTWYIKAKEPICSSAGAASRLVFQDSLTEIGNNLVGSLPAEIAFLSSSLGEFVFGSHSSSSLKVLQPRLICCFSSRLCRMVGCWTKHLDGIHSDRDWFIDRPERSVSSAQRRFVPLKMS